MNFVIVLRVRNKGDSVQALYLTATLKLGTKERDTIPTGILSGFHSQNRNNSYSAEVLMSLGMNFTTKNIEN